MRLPSRRDLLRGVTAGHRLTGGQRTAPRPPPRNSTRLSQAIRIFFDAHRSGRRYQRVVSYCERGDFRRRVGEVNRAELERIDAEVAALIHGLLQEGIAAGVFADRPIPVLLYGAQSTLIGAVRMLGSECLGAADPEEYIDEITRFVLAGLMFLDRVPMHEAAAEREAT